MKSKNKIKITKKTPKKEEIEKISKLKTEIKGLDELFSNGIPEGNSVIVEGSSGSGKTLLCLDILIKACKKGKKCLYMSFEEPEERLRDHLRDFGFEPTSYEEKGILKIKRFNALDIARSVEALLSEAQKELLIELHPVLIPKEFSPNLLVVDSISSISSAFTGEKGRFRIYMEQLFRYLENNKITSFLISEESHPTHIKAVSRQNYEEIDFLADGIISIYNVIYKNGKRGRAIEVLKMRGDNIKREIVKMEIIDKKGIVVSPNIPLEGDYLLT